MRTAALWICLVSLTAISAAAQTSTLELWIETQLRLEGELLNRSRSSYQSIRRQQIEADDRSRTLETRLEEELTSESPSVPALRALEDEALRARALAESLAARAATLRGGILGHLARIETLRALRGEAPDRAPDPVTGRWEIRVLPQGQTGVMDLDLDGTIVRGVYELDGGFQGSLRGTYVRRMLRLERVDAEEGFDMIYEGTVDPAAERIQGEWRATLLNRPGPSGGDWIANRIREDGADE